MLLYPERGLVLNATAADVVQLCTGEHTVAAIIERLAEKYAPHPREAVEREVLSLPGRHGRARAHPERRMTESAPRPYTLVAELTYRCPLRCVYCSNPLDYARHGDALGTADWLRVFREAEALGVVQLNLTGGEPLVRDDLEELVEGARALDLYTNLITSGIPCTRERLARLKACGLDNVQVSVQDVRAPESDRIAGLRSFERKLEVARLVKELGLPLTINTVLHRENLDRVPEDRSRWPSRLTPIGSSWPTRNTWAGRWSTGARSCRPASSSTGRATWRAPPASGFAAAWKCCS